MGGRGKKRKMIPPKRNKALSYLKKIVVSYEYIPESEGGTSQMIQKILHYILISLCKVVGYIFYNGKGKLIGVYLNKTSSRNNSS